MELLNVAEEASGNVESSAWTGRRLRKNICKKKSKHGGRNYSYYIEALSVNAGLYEKASSH